MTTSVRDTTRPKPADNDADILESLSGGASEAAQFLRTIGSEHRLMILCALLDGSKTVSELCDLLEARQSLISQHLTRLRLDNLVEVERRANFAHYSVKGPIVAEIISVLQTHFCPDTRKVRRR